MHRQGVGSEARIPDHAPIVRGLARRRGGGGAHAVLNSPGRNPLSLSLALSGMIPLSAMALLSPASLVRPAGGETALASPGSPSTKGENLTFSLSADQPCCV